MIKRNGLIDGWRGLSVLAVIVGHLVTYRFPQAFDTSPLHALIHDGSVLTLLNNLFFRVASSLGEIGVSFFFVISGYLITHLMLAEEARNSRINIAAFYVRRICRIAPAFYLYLFAVLMLRKIGLAQVPDEAFIRSAAYVCNFSEFKCSWWLAHTWSLSVEEQFYLAWPLLLSCFIGERTAIIALALAASTIGGIFYPPVHGFSYIAMGALVASSPAIRAAISRIADSVVIMILVLLILLYPILQNVRAASLLMQLLSPAMIAIIFFGTLDAKANPITALISSPVLQKVGVISYSLYLWQQIGTAPIEWGGTPTGADPSVLWPILFIVPSIASYLLIEQPMIRIGHTLSSRLLARYQRLSSAV